MTYDLSGLFTLIASSSATIVAIVGGFIASKLITLSTERSEVELKLSEIKQETEFLEKEIFTHQQKLDEDDALDFIEGGIMHIINGEMITKEYDTIKRPERLSFEKLRDFWNRALEIKTMLSVSLEADEITFNEDMIPLALASKLNDHPFDYAVAVMIVEEFDRLADKMRVMGMSNLKMSRMTGVWYNEVKSSIETQKSKLMWLQIKKQQLLIREKSLLSPKGMKAGLAIISIFAISCVVLPMIFLDYSTTEYCKYIMVNVLAISVFFLNLSAAIIYFVYLLHWKRNIP